MYNSINVHIENGQVILDEPISIVGYAKGILTIMEPIEMERTNAAPNGKGLADTLQKIAETNHSYTLVDPLAWQKEVRTDRNIAE